MLKKFFILSYILVLPSCFKDNYINPVQKSSPEIKTSINLNQETFDKCETPTQSQLSNIKLEKPSDLAVSADGKTIYAVSLDCNNSKPLDTSHIFCGNKTPVKRKFIYKINNNKLDILKINNEPPLSCYLSENIEIDDNNNIFVINGNQIYKISEENNLIQKLYPIIDNPLSSLSVRAPSYLYVNKNNLFANFIDNTENENKLKLYATKFNKDRMQFEDIKVLDISKSSSGLPYLSSYNDNYYENFENIITSESIYTEGYSNEISYLPIELSYIRFNSKGEAFGSNDLTNSIYKIIPNKSMELFAGNGKVRTPGFKDGKGNQALFDTPTGLSFDGQDNLYVADTGNNAIRKITPDGTVTTFYAEK